MNATGIVHHLAGVSPGVIVLLVLVGGYLYWAHQVPKGKPKAKPKPRNRNRKDHQ